MYYTISPFDLNKDQSYILHGNYNNIIVVCCTLSREYHMHFFQSKFCEKGTK